MSSLIAPPPVASSSASPDRSVTRSPIPFMCSSPAGVVSPGVSLCRLNPLHMSPATSPNRFRRHSYHNGNKMALVDAPPSTPTSDEVQAYKLSIELLQQHISKLQEENKALKGNQRRAPKSDADDEVDQLRLVRVEISQAAPAAEHVHEHDADRDINDVADTETPPDSSSWKYANGTSTSTAKERTASCGSSQQVANGTSSLAGSVKYDIFEGRQSRSPVLVREGRSSGWLDARGSTIGSATGDGFMAQAREQLLPRVVNQSKSVALEKATKKGAIQLEGSARLPVH